VNNLIINVAYVSLSGTYACKDLPSKHSKWKCETITSIVMWVASNNKGLTIHIPNYRCV